MNEYSCERSILDEAFEDEVGPFVNEVLWVRRCGEETFDEKILPAVVGHGGGGESI